MKRLILLALIVPAFFMSLGCSVKPSEIDVGAAEKISTMIIYFKDHRTGLCFAAITTRKTGIADQRGMAMAAVPCEDVDNMLVNDETSSKYRAPSKEEIE